MELKTFVAGGQISPCCADLSNRVLQPPELGPDGTLIRGPEWEIWICEGIDPATGARCGRRHIVLNASPYNMTIAGSPMG